MRRADGEPATSNLGREMYTHTALFSAMTTVMERSGFGFYIGGVAMIDRLQEEEGGGVGGK